MSTPVGAVRADNPQRGVKRATPGNPTHVPGQLPGFRGRSVDPGAAVKAPKLRNGNLNNETSNIRIPYSRIVPLEFLSSYQGRLGPGDVIFTHKYPPGFLSARADFNNATLGVNTLSRVIGLDGLNRLLMQSGPNGWRLGENVLEARDPMEIFRSDHSFGLSVLREYHLDGVVISNDEPGAFTSSGSRDNAIFNVAIQGPVEVNNGFLKYEHENDSGKPLNPSDRTYSQYNPLSGVINSRSVEAHARGSVESGMHVENQPLPGRVGNQFAANQGKVDFVANYCGTYTQFPSQMFDRRVEILNTLYLGLRAYELSTIAKLNVTDKAGNRVIDDRLSKDARKALAVTRKMFFFQFMPFSSRAASVIQAVTDKHKEVATEAYMMSNQGTLGPLPDDARKRAQAVQNFLRNNEALIQTFMQSEECPSRAFAAKLVPSVKQQTETSLPSAQFDTATYDPIRSEDLWAMVGAYTLGRVLDTKAAVHDRYAGGPRDTAFSCIVDVGVSWRNVYQTQLADYPRSQPTGFLLPPSQGGYVQTYEKDADGKDDRTKPIPNHRQAQKSGQQGPTCLANNLAPPLSSVIGSDFGRNVPLREDLRLDAAKKAADKTQAQLEAQLEEMKEKDRQRQVSNEYEQRALSATLKQQKKNAKPVTEAQAAAARKTVADIAGKNMVHDQFLLAGTKDEVDPMQFVALFMLGASKLPDADGVTLATSVREDYGGKATSDAWTLFKNKRSELQYTTPSNAEQSYLKTLFATWQRLANTEMQQIVEANKDGLLLKVTLKKAIVDNVQGAVNEIERVLKAVTKRIDSLPDGDPQKTALILERANFLMRVTHLVTLFQTLLGVINAKTDVSPQYMADLRTNSESMTQAAFVESLRIQIGHLAIVCDLHEKHFPPHDPLFVMKEPVSAPAPVAATPAAGKAPVKRGKSPSRPRPTPTSTAPSSSSASRPAPPRASAPVPAGAAGMSSVPLIPTTAPVSSAAAASAAVPRRRAREQTESVTDSMFANMFTAASTESAVEAPASPTPSSGSEGPTSGPRTFRRQR